MTRDHTGTAQIDICDNHSGSVWLCAFISAVWYIQDLSFNLHALANWCTKDLHHQQLFVSTTQPFYERHLLHFVVSFPLNSFLPLQISDTIAGLQLSISGPLTSMEELFSGSKPFLVSTRNCRRLSENVINLLSSISLTRSSVDASLGNDSSVSGASIIPLTPVPPSVAPTVVPASGLMPNPFSPGWAANTLMVNEDYRWGTTGQVFGLISIKHMEIHVLLSHDNNWSCF